MPLRTPLRRTSVVSVTAACVVGLAGWVAPPAHAEPPPAAETHATIIDKIEPELRTTLAQAPETDFWIRFADRADLSAAHRITDWAARGEAVARALRETARASQAEVRRQLDRAGQAYRSFFISNAIYVQDGPASLARDLAAQPAVAGLHQPTGYERIGPTPGEADQQLQQLQSIAWGVENIRAHQAWDQFDSRGEDITVATIDSGVQFDHPALVNQYRGNLGHGEFDHNYHWFDATGACPDAPCDLDGHGTHVTGTMVGDDGAGRQIGVAPAANWIATNGCCPSDQALIASGEWLLAPTDLAGENPDPSKRPHIINNSWGTVVPSNDPFMEDVLEAWAAAGIFAMWSNGNNGPGCETSGSPGSRVISYSAGAHNRQNVIASGSSRGPGQDGETKPDISAPGVNVLSSLPGDAYGTASGTSMAAPHVAGAVALLWSAAPGLVGDPQATAELLDLSAVDTEDLRCGGTPGDNNVYGQGRLDALELLEIAPITDIGTVAGTVTDPAGDPIEGATVTITGPVERTRTIGPDGAYSVLLPAGDYTVTTSAFGYETRTAGVTVAVDQTVTRDFVLPAVPRVTVNGRVTDGSGHGWPMYARIRVADTPVATYTDPADGSYQLSLPVDTTYSFVVTPQYPGYQRLTAPVAVGTTELVRDLGLTVDAASCTAPGYRFGSDGVFTTFNDAQQPAGWTVVDHEGNGQVWRFDNPGDRDNLTGGDGAFAAVDRSYYDGDQDTELHTPVLDLSGVADPVIQFDHAFGSFLFSNHVGEVDLSLDGGASWQNLLHVEDQSFQDRAETIPVPQAAGQPQVQVRFHYTNTGAGFWWQLDNVLVGSEVTCDPIPGGLVVGQVRDANTGASVTGATVRPAGDPDAATSSAATPDDPAQDEGFYWLFRAPAGDHELTASASRYADLTRTVTVAGSSVTHADLRLPAGQLTFGTAAVDAELTIGDATERTFTVTNTGTAPAQLQLRERGAPTVLTAMDGGDGPAGQRIDADVSELSVAAAGRSGTPAGPAPAPSEAPWAGIADYPFRVQDNIADVWDGRVYSVTGVDVTRWRDETMRYDPDTGGWTELAPIPTPRERPNGAIIDGRFYVVGGWGTDGDTTIPSLEIYDIASDTWTTGAPIPTAWAASGSAVVDGKLYLVGGCQASCGSTDIWVYDPAADAWSPAAPYPQETSWTHCGGIDGRLYCAGGSRGPSADTYAYDPAADRWSPVAPLPHPLWAGAYAVANGKLVISGGVASGQITNQGYAYDPLADVWEPIANADAPRYRAAGACGFYRIGGGIGNFIPVADAAVLPGLDECRGDVDPPWLSADPLAATLDPGERVTVTVSLAASPAAGVPQPGSYAARITVADDTPYATSPIPVTLTATPPNNWGRVTGTVTGLTCAGGQGPLAGATVALAGRRDEVTLTTGPDGGYGYWFPVQNNRLTITVTSDGYRPHTRRAVILPRREVVEDVTLRPTTCP